MNLRWMVLFATIAEEGSFTRAATRLNIAQPWLSAQIRKLEYELGVQLLVRQSAGVQVTPAGEALLPYAQQLAEAARMFRQVARSLGDAQTMIVRIGSHIPMIDLPTLRRVNQEFLLNHASYSLNSRAAGTPRLLTHLRDAEVDFVVILSPLPDDAERDFDVVPIAPARPYLLSPSKLPLLDLNDLSGRVVGAPPRSWQPDFLARVLDPLRSAGATIRDVPEVDRRAMEHFARVHETVVMMVDGATEESAPDPRFRIVSLPDVGAQHLLLRAKRRDLGRAAERYWSLAKARVL